MEKLPDDVLSNIFIRLLAKQLAQMRSVSKSMNALLSQSSFIKSHLHHSIHNNDEVLLFFYEVYDDRPPFFAHPSRSPDLELTDFIKTPVNFQWEEAKVIGSVNGLICFTNRSYNPDCVLHIWNTSLSALLTLPPYNYSMPSPGTATGNDLISINFGFGFDPKADDYKVVKIASLLQPPSNMDPVLADFLGTSYFVVKEWLQVEVYSMRKASRKLITQKPPSHITRISIEDDGCVDGHDGLLHWLGCIGEDMNEQKIVTFDLHVETFHEIHLPDSILEHNVGNRYNVIGVLAGKLCVMSYVYVGGCEVWVMDEYGVVESWVKHHAFSQFSNIAAFGFTLRNKFLFEVAKVDGDDDFDYRYGLYDPTAAKAKIFKLCLCINKIVEYVDSLVWVAPGECELR